MFSQIYGVLICSWLRKTHHALAKISLGAHFNPPSHQTKAYAATRHSKGVKSYNNKLQPIAIFNKAGTDKRALTHKSQVKYMTL